MATKLEPDLPLRGLRILVVDDEYMIRITLEQTLRDAGAEVVSADTLSTALKAAEQESFSVALLDVRLGRQTTETVADALAAHSIPFVFYSGHGLPEGMREKHPAAQVLLKPIKRNVFIESLRSAAVH